MKKHITIFIFLLAVISLSAKELIEIPFANVPPVIDGAISEGEWADAYWHDEFYQTSPGDNTEPSEKTEIGLMYDNQKIYLMAKFYFDDLNRMRDNHCSRDAIYTTDRCYFYLDTFHSNERAYYLGCNANGEQADGIVLEEIDTTIDIYYVSRAQKTDYGFSLEIMLPLESIKYKSGRNVEWGFFCKRLIPAGTEEISSHKVQRGGGNYYDNYAVIRFADLPTNRNLKLIPALVADYNRFEDKVADAEETDKNLESELNVFYEPNSSLMTRFTFNPDFNIIEADGLEIDVNDRYPRYYQEKRPFFIEQTNPFQTDVNIFYTRQIVNPIAGAKLSGSFGSTSVFALAAVDKDVPGGRFFWNNSYENKTENTIFGFASLCRKFGGNGFLRGAAAIRRFDDMNNMVLSFDANKRFSQAVNADFQVVGSTNDTENSQQEKETKNGIAAAVDLDFYNGTWFINNEFKAVSQDFRADLGFLDDVDFVKYNNRLEYQIHADTDEDLIRYMEIASSQNIKYAFDLQDVKSHYWEIMNGAILMNSFEYWTGFEVIMDHFYGRDYYTHYPWLSLKYELTKHIKLETLLVDGVNVYYNFDTLKGEFGDFYKYENTVQLRPNNLLDLEFKQKYHETEDKYIARSYEVKAKFQFHKNFWVRLIAQAINHDLIRAEANPNRISVYPLFAYKPSSQTAIYLGATGTEEKISPIAARDYIENYRDLTYFLKISYTFDVM
ncbi:MAG: hypothetical protein K9N09_10565 [Candidatus Cloacimonetes bacterium]|nr:hypothetical protein [Candidatus Cloacimonadota bacterium]MCF7814724.1 hypothetical protein [Candidatus Cloacimonadota bacterium]MCF7869135.1 hypothetical protein [Candidatus Cloacimonadota bacterium]MCF7884596.1 hypothetical protein [Candidatus Cloacimonadota bacterium]